MIWEVRSAQTGITRELWLTLRGQLESQCRVRWTHMTTDAPVQYKHSVLSMSRCLIFSGYPRQSAAASPVEEDVDEQSS